MTEVWPRQDAVSPEEAALARVLLADAMALHLDALDVAGRAGVTLANYRRCHDLLLSYLSESLGRAPTLADLTERSWSGYLRWLEHEHTSHRWGGSTVGHGATNRRYHATIIRALANFCVRRRLLRANPFAALDLPKAPTRVQASLSYDQVMLLADLASRTQERFRNEAVILFLFESGMRISELCGLQIEDIELVERGRETGRAKVHGKGAKDRHVPLGGRTSDALRAYWRLERPKTSSELAFLTRDGEPLRRQLISQVLHELAQRAGLKQRVTPHVLRRAFAREFLNQHPGEIETLRILMGHENIAQTLAYARHQRTEAALGVRSIMDARRDQRKRGIR